MPPLIMLALGAIGAVVLVKLIAKEARRINTELHPKAPAPVVDERETARRLERDPVTGIYRPE